MYKMSIIGNLTLDWTGQYKKGEEKSTLGRKVRNIVWSKIIFFSNFMYLFAVWIGKFPRNQQKISK